MSPLIAERIAELRKEIAQILASNRLASIAPVPYQQREAMKERREERLREILEELRALRSEK